MTITVNVTPLCYRRIVSLADRREQDLKYEDAYRTALPVIQAHITNKALAWGWLSHTYAIERTLWCLYANQKLPIQFRYVHNLSTIPEELQDEVIYKDYIIGSTQAMQCVENWLCNLQFYHTCRLVTTMSRNCAIMMLAMNVGFKEIENELA